MTETLDELAVRHGTDKSREEHDFARIYETYLSRWRDEPITILEIGILEGASLRMWCGYFSNARIFGLDCNPAALEHQDARIAIVIGDQADPVTLDALLARSGPLDLVVDDGGHRARQQIGSLLRLWQHVKPGGVYAIEDIHTSYLEPWGMSWRAPGTTVEFLKGVVDDVQAQWHAEPTTLAGLESIHFYPELCILTKEVRPRRPGDRVTET